MYNHPTIALTHDNESTKETDMTLFRKFLCLFTLCLAASAVASAASADTATLPNPLKDVKAGQWVVYRINTLFGAAEQKQTVENVEGVGDERVFTIKTEMSIEDELVDERTDNITYKQAMEEQDKALAEAEDVDIANTQVDVKGAKMDAVQVSFSQDGTKCTLFLSERVPLVGMIRMEVEGMDEPAMELLDFGE